ncbi:MAG: prepilin peptidase [Candidatus Odinarchaeota archaeon]
MTIILILTLTAASLQDIYRRVVNDLIWFFGIFSGLLVNLLQGLNPFTWVISILSGLALASLSFRTGFTSGGDGKAIITVSAIQTSSNQHLLLYFDILPPIFEIYVLFLFSASSLTLSILISNLAANNYTDLAGIKLSQKIKILLSCVKINISRIDYNKHLVIEKIIDNRKIISLTRAPSPDTDIEKLKNYKQLRGEEFKVWIYNKWPLIPLILLSSVISIL